jgi:magnesium-transporting ATPase (P-type)
MQAMALNTNATFGYAPDQVDQKLFIAAYKAVPVDKITDDDIKGPNMPAIIDQLIKTEKEQSIIERKVVGDASETGLVKFVAPTLGDTPDSLGDLDTYRERYPMHQYKAGKEDIKCEIPFNSEIKFNLVIRKVDKKLVIFMKGAPDRIIERCNKIIIDGEI